MKVDPEGKVDVAAVDLFFLMGGVNLAERQINCREEGGKAAENPAEKLCSAVRRRGDADRI